MDMHMHLQEATEADLPAIVDIYNQSIPAGWSTTDTNPITVAARVEWFRKFDPNKRPIWVVEVEGQVEPSRSPCRHSPKRFGEAGTP